MIVSLDDAVAASGATLLQPDRLPAALRFSTDTRTIADGDAFVALRGERFDGHAFIAAALARGASALVVSDPRLVPNGVGALVVGDVTAAYLAFAGAVRRSLRARVVAITGSTGKTTTKSLLVQLLGSAGLGTVAASEANENNEIGVAKLFLGLEPDVALVVAEFGARHFGEIEPLARVARPDVAVLTNIGDAHLEIMGSAERLAETKWGIFATGAQSVLNLDDPVSCARAGSLEREPRWFAGPGHGLADRSAQGYETLVIDRSQLIVRARERALSYPIRCTLPGAHNLSNVAAAAAAALALGAEAGQIAQTVATLELPPGRYERSRVGDIELIFDAYNASMAGTLATLRSFAGEPGEGAPQMHERVGAAAAESGLAALLVGGDYAEALARGARGAGLEAVRLVQFAHNDQAVAWLREHARAGDLVLLKGSRKYQLEQVRDGLKVAYA